MHVDLVTQLQVHLQRAAHDHTHTAAHTGHGSRLGVAAEVELRAEVHIVEPTVAEVALGLAVVVCSRGVEGKGVVVVLEQHTRLGTYGKVVGELVSGTQMHAAARKRRLAVVAYHVVTVNITYAVEASERHVVAAAEGHRPAAVGHAEVVLAHLLLLFVFGDYPLRLGRHAAAEEGQQRQKQKFSHYVNLYLPHRKTSAAHPCTTINAPRRHFILCDGYFMPRTCFSHAHAERSVSSSERSAFHPSSLFASVVSAQMATTSPGRRGAIL